MHSGPKPSKAESLGLPLLAAPPGVTATPRAARDVCRRQGRAPETGGLRPLASCPCPAHRESERKGVAVMRKLNVGDAPAMSPGTADHRCTAVITEQPPLAYRSALWAVISCAASTARLLWRRQLHLPRGHAGMRLRFAD